MYGAPIDILLRLNDQTGAPVAQVQRRLKDAETQAERVGAGLGRGMQKGAAQAKSEIERSIANTTRFIGMGAAVWAVGNRIGAGIDAARNAARERITQAADAAATQRAEELRRLDADDRTARTATSLRLAGVGAAAADRMAGTEQGDADRLAALSVAAERVGRLGLSATATAAVLERAQDAFSRYGEVSGYRERLLDLLGTASLATRKDLGAEALRSLRVGARMSTEAEAALLERWKAGTLTEADRALLRPDPGRKAGTGRITFDETLADGSNRTTTRTHDLAAKAGDADLMDVVGARDRSHQRRALELAADAAAANTKRDLDNATPTAADYAKELAKELGPILAGVVIAGIAQTQLAKRATEVATSALGNAVAGAGAGAATGAAATGAAGTAATALRGAVRLAPLAGTALMLSGDTPVRPLSEADTDASARQALADPRIRSALMAQQGWGDSQAVAILERMHALLQQQLQLQQQQARTPNVQGATGPQAALGGE
jgi:hypothetical protein